MALPDLSKKYVSLFISSVSVESEMVVYILPCHLHNGIDIICSTYAGDLGSWMRSVFKAVFDQLYHQVFWHSVVLFSWYFAPILIY